jgi:hypothetical protein
MALSSVAQPISSSLTLPLAPQLLSLEREAIMQEPSSAPQARLDPLGIAGGLFVLGLYGAALYLPAVEFTDEGPKRDVEPGLFALLAAICVPFLWTGLYANYLVLKGVFALALGRYSSAKRAGGLGMFSGAVAVLTFLMFWEVQPALHIGCWVWLASLASLFGIAAWRDSAHGPSRVSFRPPAPMAAGS